MTYIVESKQIHQQMELARKANVKKYQRTHDLLWGLYDLIEKRDSIQNSDAMLENIIEAVREEGISITHFLSWKDAHRFKVVDPAVVEEVQRIMIGF